MALLGQSYHCTLLKGEFFMGSLRRVSVSSSSSASCPCTIQCPLTASPAPPNYLIASSSSPTKGSSRIWQRRTMMTRVVCCKDDYSSRVLNSQLGDPQKQGRRQGRLKKELVVVRASSEVSSANHSEGDHFEVVFGREISKKDLRVASTAVAVIGLSVANKVLYKMALVPMNRYPFFLAQANTFGYVIAYNTILLIRYRAGIVTKEMLALPKLRFLALGALEALGIASGMAAAANIAGAAIPIVHQLFLVWQLLLSTTILRKRYARGQILGCLLVILGVLVVVTNGADAVVPQSLQQSGFIWPLIMVFSTACTAAASILKEFIFVDAAKRLQGGTVDIFVVNSLGSSFQALFVLLLLPFLSNLRGIPFQQLPTYLSEGAACFLNKGGIVGNACEGAPLVPLLYIFTNLAFNICGLSLLKQSSAVVTSLCGTVAVPLTIWAFTLPLPLLGAQASLPPRLFVGAAILLAGLASYNISGESQRRELNGQLEQM